MHAMPVPAPVFVQSAQPCHEYVHMYLYMDRDMIVHIAGGVQSTWLRDRCHTCDVAAER